MTGATPPGAPGSRVQVRVALIAIAGAWVAAMVIGWPLVSTTARVLCGAAFVAVAARALRGPVRTTALALVLAAPVLLALIFFDNLASAPAGIGTRLMEGAQLALVAATVAAALGVAWADGERHHDELPRARVRKR